MSNEKKKWSSDQVIEAFKQFRNSDAMTDNEKEDNKLRALLKKLDKETFEAKDISSITEQFVPAYCSDRLATAVICYLK